MSKPNLLNPEAIDAWFLTLATAKDAARGEDTARLLSIGLKRHFLQEEKTAVLLSAPPADAPDWAKNKWDICGPFHRFVPENDPGLQEKMNHLIDWLVSAQINNAPFLQDTLNGKPKTLLHLSSVDHAIREADRYFSDLNKKFAKAAQAQTEGDIKTVLDFGDGYKIVELLTQNALKLEGPKMGHCVGGGAYDDGVEKGTTKIFSLRDKNNEPHVTFEIGVAKNTLKQCKGKENGPAVAAYMPYVEAFVRQGKFKPVEAARYTNLFQDDDGVVYSFYAMPKTFSVGSDLNLRDCTELTQLPEHLSVSGRLSLRGCTGLTQLPENLSVGGHIDLKGCTGLTQLPKMLHCEGVITMPVGKGFKGADWAKARAYWMEQKGMTDSPALVQRTTAAPNNLTF
jgi:hypothetical protein